MELLKKPLLGLNISPDQPKQNMANLEKKMEGKPYNLKTIFMGNEMFGAGKSGILMQKPMHLNIINLSKQLKKLIQI